MKNIKFAMQLGSVIVLIRYRAVSCSVKRRTCFKTRKYRLLRDYGSGTGISACAGFFALKNFWEPACVLFFFISAIAFQFLTVSEDFSNLLSDTKLL